MHANLATDIKSSLRDETRHENKSRERCTRALWLEN